jgi:speckle-type POZ protein
MVQFFYSMDYDDTLPADADLSLFQLHARMFSLADEYMIPSLLSVAADKYSAQCLGSWNPSEFLSSIHDVYNGTPSRVSRLRRAACTAMRSNLPTMLKEEAIARHYDQTITENPEFAKDLLRSYVRDPVFRHCYTCGLHRIMETLQVRCTHCKRGQ